jgi:hypothetical protein
MLGLSDLISAGAQIPQNLSPLPHYETNLGEDLPANAAPIGGLADGDIYHNAYKMLTPGDIPSGSKSLDSPSTRRRLTPNRQLTVPR